MTVKIRGYDSSNLFREDALLRIQKLESEIREIQGKIDEKLREIKLTKERR